MEILETFQRRGKIYQRASLTIKLDPMPFEFFLEFNFPVSVWEGQRLFAQKNEGAKTFCTKKTEERTFQAKKRRGEDLLGEEKRGV